MPRRFTRFMLCVLLICGSPIQNAYSNEANSLQDAVSNALLQIPFYATVSGKPGKTLVLCVDASPDFLTKLTKLNESMRSFAIVQNAARLNSCDVLYIETTKSARRVLLNNSAANLLTISRYDAFIDEGGVINITDKNGKISIGINLSAAKENRINLSAALIELATRVIQ